MRSLYISLLLFLSCPGLFAQAGFFRRDTPIGDRPTVVLAGDFNGDSQPDLAVNSFSGHAPE